MYLVDTNVISAIATGKPGSAGLTRWLRDNTGDVYLSAVTIAEIESGIAKVRRDESRRRADSFAEWLETMLHLHDLRIIPLDIQEAVSQQPDV